MILVSILGDFDSSILPIFYEMKDSIKKHIIIYDDSKYDELALKKILKGQEEISKLQNLDFEIILLKIDEDDYTDIVACYNAIIKHSNRDYDDIYLNGTDGLVSSVVVLANRLINLGANFIAYDKFDNQFNIITKDSMKKVPITSNNTIQTHLIQKGYEFYTVNEDVITSSRKESIYTLCKDLDYFQSFANSLHQSKPSLIEGFDDIKQTLEKIEKLDSVPFIQGTVFEEYIYWLIKDNLDFDDVKVGVKIEFEDSLENEFDILMIKDNHLHTIECKLRRNVPGENHIYKLDSIMKHLDDDGKGMLLVIGGENEIITKRGNRILQFSNGTRTRAKESNIKIHHHKSFDKKRFLDDVEKHFINEKEKNEYCNK